MLSAFEEQAGLPLRVAPALLGGTQVDAAANGGAAGGWRDIVEPRVSAGDLEKVRISMWHPKSYRSDFNSILNPIFQTQNIINFNQRVRRGSERRVKPCD